MKRKILIIGTGGIGSFLIPLLDKTELYNITAHDPDIIEKKNISYQNFNTGEIDKKKVMVMKNRYSSIKKAEPFLVLTEKQIQGYDLVVCCADNLDVRRLLYRSSTRWLDLRAQGRNGALISYKTPKDMFDVVLAGPDGSFSCQGTDWAGDNSGLHFTHVAIAGMAAEWIQRWFISDSDVCDYKVVNI
ncbi:MAG: putative ThiF family protein [Prokaryotic dsDNA virus sp.]|nr:MAG: putative ThiF family protein [Prokaryotic dsDNA virus sp.]|tara:strand:- start:6428 stop:6991 length:564 start_codon:yes stop_codon:yes gene_type:complete